MRRRACVVVAFLILLSGCVRAPDHGTSSASPSLPQRSPGPSGGSPAHPVDRSATPSALPNETSAIASNSTILDREHEGAETSLAIAPDGTLYACAPTWLMDVVDVATGGSPASLRRNLEDVSSHLWRSSDGGSTWIWLAPSPLAKSPVVTRGAADGGGDCDVAVDPAGTLYFVDLSGAHTGLAVSRDRGDSWNSTTPLPILPVDDREWVLAPQEGTVYVVAHELATGILVAKSIDGGKTFPSQTPVFLDVPVGVDTGGAGNASCACPPSKPAASTDGQTILVAWNKDVANGTLAVAFTQDAGSTWTTRTVGGAGPIASDIPSVAVDRAGDLYVAWAAPSPTGTEPHVQLVSSRDGGVTWTRPAALTDKAGQAEGLPWIVAGDRGAIDVTFARAATNQTEDWDVYVAQSLDALDAAPIVHEARVSPTPALVATPLRRPLADYFESALDAHGNFLVAWASETDEATTIERFARQTAGPTTTTH